MLPRYSFSHLFLAAGLSAQTPTGNPIGSPAQINYLHFPPMLMRWLARTTSAEGPAGHDMNLLNEQLIDTYLRNIPNIASGDFTVQLPQQL